MALDKLECIKLDLIRTDDEWREWDFPKLVGGLREWTFRNPLRTDNGSQQTQTKRGHKTIQIQEGKRISDKNKEAKILCLLQQGRPLLTRLQRSENHRGT